MPSTTFSQAPLKGSWEAQLTEAEQLARNFNDACLPIFDKLYTRLGKMPKARRMAADERLQQIFLRAADDYQGYLLMREQYDRALEVIERMEEELEGEEAHNWRYHVILALRQAGRLEDAIDRLRPEPDLPIQEALNEWGSFATFLIGVDQLDEAEAVVDQISARMEESTELDEEKRRLESGYWAIQRMRIAVRRQDWQEGVTWFDEAISWNDAYTAQIGELYQPIVVKGPPALALRLIEREDSQNIGRLFWRGVAYLRAGEEKKARRDWGKLVSTESDPDHAPSLIETILAIYYLGDPERVGLSAVLQTLQEGDPQDWMLLTLAGLGWALHDNMANAHSNLEIAMLMHRMSRPSGKYLPAELWDHTRLLLDEESLGEIAPYFGMEVEQDSIQAEVAESPEEEISEEEETQGGSAEGENAEEMD